MTREKDIQHSNSLSHTHAQTRAFLDGAEYGRAEAAERILALEAKCDLLSAALKKADGDISESKREATAAKKERDFAERLQERTQTRAEAAEEKAAYSSAAPPSPVQADARDEADRRFEAAQKRFFSVESNRQLMQKLADYEHPDTVRLRECVREIQERYDFIQGVAPVWLGDILSKYEAK